MRLLPPGSAEQPAVSIVIRARDEAAYLGRCLEALLAQDFPGPAEVILVDSGSTDGTLDIARRHPVRIITIAPESFTFSSALNLGFSAARAPLAAALSAHAVPADERWMGALVRALDDPLAAGAYSREIPWADADLYERLRLEAAFPPYRITKSLALAVEPGDRERVELYSFSNAAALLRRRLWEERPFRELPYAEDLDWARWALERGHSIVYEPAARVRHSHREAVRPRAAREVLARRALAAIFGYRPSRLGEILRNLKSSGALALRAVREPISVGQKWYWGVYALRKWLAFTKGWLRAAR